MSALLPVIYLTRLFAGFALLYGALFGGNASAEIYQCKLKNGKVEMRDFPCNASIRPLASVSQPSPQTASQHRPKPFLYEAPQSFATIAQYKAARSICMRLMAQYDFTIPINRCRMNDLICFQRANQESSAIFQRLTALPEWKLQQCDLVMQVEGAATNGDQKIFEVVGTVRGCKYFVAEQESGYSLVEEWSCFQPSRGDYGYGDINNYGMKEVNLNGAMCSVYVDDWSLNRSRAAEKLSEKCR